MMMFLIVVFNILVYTLGFFIVYKNKGVKNNLPFFFSLLLFVIYYFVTPLYFYCIGRKTIWGNEGTNKGIGVDITDFYHISLAYYGLANLFFILGYISIKSKPFLNNISYSYFNPKTKQGAILVTFIICYSIVLANFLKEGFNPFLVLFGDSENAIAGEVATSNYLKNFSDSIIAVLIISYYINLPKKYFYPIVAFSFLLFALMGFRYRIILSLIGFYFTTLFKNNNSKNKWKYAIILPIFIYTLMFITYNRFVFTTGNWQKLTANPINFDYSILFEQTRGMLDDITIIKYYHTAEEPSYDYGVTFLYFFIRAMPRSIVGNEFKDSFYPFPAQKIIIKAYDVEKYWGKSNTGEAPLHLAYFYIAGGVPALIFLSYFTGLFIKLFLRKFPPISDNNIMLIILLSAGLFQWITRGYFPGFVDHIAFMLIGFWMFKKISKVGL